MCLLFLIILLMSNAVTLKRDKSILYSRITIIIILYVLFLLYFNINLIFFKKSISIYNNLLYVQNHTFFFTFFLFLLTGFILLFTSFYPRTVLYNFERNKQQDSLPMGIRNLYLKNYIYEINKILNITGEQYKIIEYPLIILFVILGGTFLISSCNYVSVFLSLELQSYGLYLLCAIYRNSELATNAGLMYFLLGGLSSCIILLGMSLLYINSGNLNLDGIYIINSICLQDSAFVQEISNDNFTQMFTQTTLPEKLYELYSSNGYIQLSILILSIGFLFKMSAAPFHFWSPDVYDAIPTIVTSFVAIIAKITLLIFLLELVYYTTITYLNFSWNMNLLISSLLSLFIGSILGLTQFRIKRLYAYSTINHIGFILLSLTIQSIESVQGFFFYLLQYSISNLNAFFILITIGYSFFLMDNKKIYNLAEKRVHYVSSHSENEIESSYENINNNMQMLNSKLSPVQYITQLKGYFYVNPLLAISLSITLFSFIGIPPLLGFFAKQIVLSAALDNGYIFMTLIAIITSVISAVYYLYVLQQMFFVDVEINKVEKGGGSRDIQLDKSWMTNNQITVFLSSSLSCVIANITLFLFAFIFIPYTSSIVLVLSLFIFYC